MRTLRLAILCAAYLLAAGCAMHVIEVQQGTIITPEMVAQLKPGMTRNQVKFVMGTPPITDPFRHDRWDYIYTLTQNHREVQHRHIALFFEGDQLAKILDDEAHPARGPG